MWIYCVGALTSRPTLDEGSFVLREENCDNSILVSVTRLTRAGFGDQEYVKKS